MMSQRVCSALLLEVPAVTRPRVHGHHQACRLRGRYFMCRSARPPPTRRATPRARPVTTNDHPRSNKRFLTTSKVRSRWTARTTMHHRRPFRQYLRSSQAKHHGKLTSYQLLPAPLLGDTRTSHPSTPMIPSLSLSLTLCFLPLSATPLSVLSLSIGLFHSHAIIVIVVAAVLSPSFHTIITQGPPQTRRSPFVVGGPMTCAATTDRVARLQRPSRHRILRPAHSQRTTSSAIPT